VEFYLSIGLYDAANQCNLKCSFFINFQAVAVKISIFRLLFENLIIVLYLIALTTMMIKNYKLRTYIKAQFCNASKLVRGSGECLRNVELYGVT